MKMKRLLSVLLAVVLVVSCAVVATSVVASGANVAAVGADSDLATTSAYEDMLAQTSAENGYGLAPTVNEGTILQAWNWSFKNIESMLPTLAEQGFTTIQVSPPNEIKAGTKGVKVLQRDNKNGWWMFYQPAGFQLNNSTDNALGNKAEFTSMCAKAKEYGIKIIVDAVINHMGTCDNEDKITSTNPMDHLTPKAKQFEPEIVNAQAFHKPWANMTYKEDPNQFSQYDSTYDLTRNCTSRLPDLDTGNQIVQNAIYDYMAELIEAGASGFRFDAAKHIETPDDISSLRSDFWTKTLGKVRKNYPDCEVYAYGEILNTCGVNRPFSMYTKLFDVTDSGSYWGIKDAATNGGGNAIPYYPNGNFTSANTILWDESHDTYMDGATTSLNVIQRGKIWALCAGRANITTVYFARPDDSTSTNACYNVTLGDAKKTAWSNATTKAINQFHNYFVGKAEYCTSSGGWAYIERGDAGCIIVRLGGATSGTFSGTNHKLKNGTYKDAITGNTFKVANNKISGSVGNTGVACIYYDEVKPTEPPTQKPTPKPTEPPTQPPTQPPTVYGQGKLMGDADDDDNVTIFDATRIQRVLADLAKKTEFYDVVGDVDQDKDVTILDATAIQRYLASLPMQETDKIDVRVGGGIVITPTSPYIQPTSPYVQPTSPYIQPTDPYTPTDPYYPTDPITDILHRDGYYTVIFSNSQGWQGSINLYYWTSGQDGPELWPGVQMEFYDTNEFGQAQYIGFVPMDCDNFIVSAGDEGSPQSVDMPISGHIGVWAEALDAESGKWTLGTWDL